MPILTAEKVAGALAMRFEDERRYHVLRSLIPIGEWPLCLHEAHNIVRAREERQQERIKAGSATRMQGTERSEAEDQALYGELLERTRAIVGQDEFFWAMHETPVVAWDEASITSLAREEFAKYDAATYEGERLLRRMDLSTLAWVCGLEPGQDDEESVAGLRAHLGLSTRSPSPIAPSDESEEPLL